MATTTILAQDRDTGNRGDGLTPIGDVLEMIARTNPRFRFLLPAVPAQERQSTVTLCPCLAAAYEERRELTVGVIVSGWRAGLPTCDPACPKRAA